MGTLLNTPLIMGPLMLRNRVVMAPLTRMRAQMPGNIPRELNARYYAQRASAGLIISEATPISPMGHGYYGTPGIHNSEQVEGWKLVTKAVHEHGTPMFLQLWHVGRVSHNDLLPGGVLPVGPSALSAGGQAPTATGPKPHPIARALETSEISAIVADYLTDRWGTFRYVFRQLDRFPLAYVHMVEPRVIGNVDAEPQFDLPSSRFRKLLTGDIRLISAGGHNRETAIQTLANNQADLIAFGRLFIANPDLPARLEENAPLNPYDRLTFYGGTDKGYIDYPALKESPTATEHNPTN